MQDIQHGLKTLQRNVWRIDDAIDGYREELETRQDQVQKTKMSIKHLEEERESILETIALVQSSMESEMSKDITDEDADQLTLHFGGSDPVRDLAMAIVKTREYVLPTKLPAIEGWDWYDALKKHAPDILQQILDEEHNAKIREENREKMEVELNADMQEETDGGYE